MLKYAHLLWAALLLAFCAPAHAGSQVPLKMTAHKNSGHVISFDGRFLVLEFEGTGTMSHLGQVSALGVETLDTFTGYQELDVLVTAANGDQLSFFLVGGFISPTDSGGTYTVVGGTGRFLGASGSGEFVSLNLADPVIFDGTLSTPGSNKK